MNIRIEKPIWEVAKVLRKEFISKHPDEPIGMNIAVVAALGALKNFGYAEEELDTDGNSTWSATPKFLRENGLEHGPFITLGPGVH
jgi:hypothetical protein